MLSRAAALLALVFVLCSGAAPAKAAERVFLGDLNPESVFVSWDDLLVNRTIGDEPVYVDGRRCDRYLFTHAASRVTYKLPEGATRFTAVGVAPRDPANKGTWFYEVLLDGEMRYRSRVLADLPDMQVRIDVPIPRGARRITLVVDNNGDGFRDHSVWAEPYLEFAGPLAEGLRRELTPRPAADGAAPTSRNVVSKLPAELLGAVAVVRGEKGSGTGFVARHRGVVFLFTNLHVVAGSSRVTATTSSGRTLTPGTFYGAKGRDIAMLRLTGTDEELAALPAFEVAPDALAAAKVGDILLVPGNSEGGGSILQSEGRLVAFGPDRVEHDAPTVRGNSGSPILAPGSWQVIAIDAFSRARRQDEISDAARQRSDSTLGGDYRNFGVRIDSVAEWESIDWAEWKRQCEALDRLQAEADTLLAFLQGKRDDWSTNQAFAGRIRQFEQKMKNQDLSGPDYRATVNDLVGYVRAYAQRLARDCRSPAGVRYGWLRTQCDELAAQGDAIVQAVDGLSLRITDLLEKYR